MKSPEYSFLDRLMFLFGLKDLEGQYEVIGMVEDNDALDNETQFDVAMEEALASSLEMILLQKNVWNELVSELEEGGLNVGIDDGAKEQFSLILSRLRASMTVVGESIGIPEEIMKGIIQ